MLALDTNRYTDFVRGVPDVVRELEQAPQVYFPFVVLAELRSGFLRGSRPQQNEQTLQQFLGRPGVQILYPDEQTTRHYADLYVQLRRQGTPIPQNDLWIAALVIQHSLTLYARDAHFDAAVALPVAQNSAGSTGNGRKSAGRVESREPTEVPVLPGVSDDSRPDQHAGADEAEKGSGRGWIRTTEGS